MTEALAPSPWRLCVAPMLDWTDRHCRFLHRLITPRTRLYTEMVTTGALIHGDRARHLDFHVAEHPVALQIGGSEPEDLARCARWAREWGYDEVNLNCGCPSERVQRGAFGACLMAEAGLVADGLKSMQDAVDIPVTVKHRIGIDRIERYEFVRDFVGTLHERSGCRVFIVHARNAWLQGLSPKENREVPPLRHDLVHRLKRDFPRLTIVINGGIASPAQIDAQLQQVDGVMVGRAAYHDPWLMVDWDARHLGGMTPRRDRLEVERRYVAYMQRQVALGVPWPHMARHLLGLWHGQPGARHWRRVWSDARLRHLDPAQVHARAHAGAPAPATADSVAN